MIAAFTGHRPERLRGRIVPVSSAIQGFLIKESPSKVISGMAPGVDQLAAGWSRALHIPWTAAVPFAGQSSRWPKAHQDMYVHLLESAETIEVISERYHKGVYDIRDRWMVDRCDVLAAVWDGKTYGGTYNTIEYAKSIGREIRYLEWL